MSKLVVYLCHPVGASTSEGVRANLARAKRWLWWLRCNTDWSIVCPWLPLVECALDSGVSEPEERERGLADCLASVAKLDAIVLVGGRVSSGMALERDHAVKYGLEIVDLTEYGGVPRADVRLEFALGWAAKALRAEAGKGGR